MRTPRSAGLLLLAVCACLSGCGQRPTPANTLIRQPGTHLSPNGVWKVAVVVQSDGGMTYSMVHPGGSSVAHDTVYNTPWIMCWDRTDRLWVYVEGTGLHYWHTSGKNTAGGSGFKLDRVPAQTVEEMPTALLRAIPDSVKKEWGNG